MWQPYDVRPGPSSQTTSTVANFVVQDSINLSFFDADSPIIQGPTRSSWEKVVNEVLCEHAELWERLSEL